MFIKRLQPLYKHATPCHNYLKVSFMDRSQRENRRKIQVRNFWAYHDRRNTPQPNGGYESVCQCGKAVAFCPDCIETPESDFSIVDQSALLE
jgi:hypothetical protein